MLEIVPKALTLHMEAVSRQNLAVVIHSINKDGFLRTNILFICVPSFQPLPRMPEFIVADAVPVFEFSPAVRAVRRCLFLVFPGLMTFDKKVQ